MIESRAEVFRNGGSVIFLLKTIRLLPSWTRFGEEIS